MSSEGADRLKKLQKKYKQRYERTKLDFIQFIKKKVQLSESKSKKFIDMIQQQVSDQFSQQQLIKLFHYIAAYQAGQSINDLEKLDDQKLESYTKIKFKESDNKKQKQKGKHPDKLKEKDQQKNQTIVQKNQKQTKIQEKNKQRKEEVKNKLSQIEKNQNKQQQKHKQSFDDEGSRKQINQQKGKKQIDGHNNQIQLNIQDINDDDYGHTQVRIAQDNNQIQIKIEQQQDKQLRENLQNTQLQHQANHNFKYNADHNPTYNIQINQQFLQQKYKQSQNLQRNKQKSHSNKFNDQVEQIEDEQQVQNYIYKNQLQQKQKQESLKQQLEKAQKKARQLQRQLQKQRQQRRIQNEKKQQQQKQRVKRQQIQRLKKIELQRKQAQQRQLQRKKQQAMKQKKQRQRQQKQRQRQRLWKQKCKLQRQQKQRQQRLQNLQRQRIQKQKVEHQKFLQKIQRQQKQKQRIAKLQTKKQQQMQQKDFLANKSPKQSKQQNKGKEIRKKQSQNSNKGGNNIKSTKQNELQVLFDNSKSQVISIEKFEKTGQDFMNPVIKYQIEYTHKKQKYFTFRRYSQIQKLLSYLRYKYQGVVLPEMPPKEGIKGSLFNFWKSSVNQQFLHDRKLKLKQLLNRIMACQFVNKDQELHKFLTDENFQVPTISQQVQGSYLQSIIGLKDVVFNYNELKDYGMAYYNYIKQYSKEEINTECSKEFSNLKPIMTSIMSLNEYRLVMNANFQKRRQIMHECQLKPKEPTKTEFEAILEEAQTDCNELNMQYGRYLQLKSTQGWENYLLKQKEGQGGESKQKIQQSHNKTMERIKHTQQNLMRSIERFYKKNSTITQKINYQLLQWRKKAHP